MYFPKVSGSNLLREKKQLPEDFSGALNVVIIAFLQHQQYDVNTWLPQLAELEERYPSLQHFELPTISARGKMAQWWIDEGMRMGIPDPQTRAHTITLYLDKQSFCQALRIEDDREIVLLLLDGEGEILWRGRGEWDAAQGVALQAQIESRFL